MLINNLQQKYLNYNSKCNGQKYSNKFCPYSVLLNISSEKKQNDGIKVSARAAIESC